MASVLNFSGAHLQFLEAVTGGLPSPADLTSLLSYEWIEIETVACLAAFCDKDRLGLAKRGATHGLLKRGLPKVYSGFPGQTG
jgi:hypothetical protein